MSALAVIQDRAATLGDLAQAIRHEHIAVHKSAMTMLYHGIACGELLIQAKAEVPRGDWTRWVAANVPEIGQTTVCQYMQVARHKEMLLACEDVTTMQHALWKLRDERQTTRTLRSVPEIEEIATEARENGINATARKHGMNYTTVQRYSKGLIPARDRSEFAREADHRERRRASGFTLIVERVRAAGEARKAGDRAALAAALDDLAEAATEFASRLREGTARA